jgi:hypothetical protein
VISSPFNAFSLTLSLLVVSTVDSTFGVFVEPAVAVGLAVDVALFAEHAAKRMAVMNISEKNFFILQAS